MLDILKVGRRSIFEQVSDRVGAVFQELHGPGRKTSQTSPYDQEAAAQSLEPFPDFGSMTHSFLPLSKQLPFPKQSAMMSSRYRLKLCQPTTRSDCE